MIIAFCFKIYLMYLVFKHFHIILFDFICVYLFYFIFKKAQHINGICGPSHQTECGTRPFLRWVQVQSRSPDAPGGFKNVSGPVGIPLKRITSGARRYTQPLQRGLKPEVRPPEARGMFSDVIHPTKSVPLTLRPAEVCPINILRST